MTRPAIWGAVLLVSASALLGFADLAAAQEEQVDSVQLRILERLRSLARPPGADSALFLQDSARVAEATLGNRPAGEGMDEVATELIGMPGYTLTEYEAGSTNFDVVRRVLVLDAAEGGRARVTRGGMVIEADTSITFDEVTGQLTTVGQVTATVPDGNPIEAANMIYNLSEGRGSAFDAETSFNQDGANWLTRGQMDYASPDSTFMSHAQFTSCDIEEPHYHFETDHMKVVAGNVLVARGVRLYFADVPVLWLPFMAQSLARGRSSGLLTPRFSVNDIVRTSGNYRRRVSNMGFYWAMGEHSDALVAMDWFSETFFSLTGSFRYRFSRQFLDGDLNVRRFWSEDGSTDLAIDTHHSWDLDERTQLRVSGRFVTSNDFVRENSFNPREVTQSIDSEGGINRRFDWGALSLSANRKQYLSDDRTDWLLPSANLSLSPITLFRAPSAEARFWNNMTWSGGGGFKRNTYDRIQPDTFALSTANTATSSSFARSNLSLGGLTFSQSVNLAESETFGVPEALLLLGDSAEPATLVSGVPVRDISESKLGWSTSVNYQQQLIGSTTITPRLSISGDMFRSNTDPLAQSFVSGPARIAFGAQLKTDIYGFFPGFGSFEAIRHKISPSFDYQWSPESTPTELQQSVFGSRALQPKNAISISLTQTFEAKRSTDIEEVSDRQAVDSTTLAEAQPIDRLGEPRRVEQAQTLTLLAIRTSIVRYDFVQADSVGTFLSGFETTQLSNQISSDFLRGLSISMNHELFDDVVTDGVLQSRTFDPHLSQVNLSFALGSSSPIFRWLRLGGGGDDNEPPEEPEANDLLDVPGTMDESMIVPVSGRDRLPPERTTRSGATGGWNVNLTYSLQRPRDPELLVSQMLSGMLRLQPTENWSLSWRTAYDMEAGAFNDHSIRLSRDLHRWQANFDFLQTATGNWSFRFEVSLLDNRDLKFDYKQRNLDLGLPAN